MPDGIFCTTITNVNICSFLTANWTSIVKLDKKWLFVQQMLNDSLA